MGEKRVCFILLVTVHSREARAEAQAGTEGETTEECCLLDCSLACTQLLPAQLKPTHLGMVLFTSGLGLPASLGNQEHAPEMCPQASLMEEVLQLRFSLLRCVTLMTKISHLLNCFSCQLYTPGKREPRLGDFFYWSAFVGMS